MIAATTTGSLLIEPLHACCQAGEGHRRGCTMVRAASLPSAVTVPSKSSVSTQFRISSFSSVRSAYSLCGEACRRTQR